MPKARDIIAVSDARFGCDGGSEALGHPMVYLTIPRSGHIDCPYCGRRFVLDAKAQSAAGH